MIKKRSLKGKLLAFLSFLPIAIFGQDLDLDLQAHYDFNGPSVEDRSFNEIDGIALDLTATKGVEDSLNSGFQFNGISSRVDFGVDNRGITKKVSLSGWIKTESTDRQFVFAKYNASQDRGYFLATLNGTATLGGRDGSNQFYEIYDEEVLINDGEWHHIVGIIDGNDWKLFVDCQEVASLTTNTASPNFASTDPLTAGYWHEGSGDGNQRYFDGAIDELRLYNRVLDMPDIEALCFQENYIATWNTAYGLKAYYDFNQAEGIIDLSETAINGVGFDLTVGRGIEDTTGSAYLFNGQSSRIECSTSNRDIIDQVSLSAWIKTKSSERQFIFAKYNSSQDAGYFLATLNGTATLGGRDGSNTFHEIFDADLLINDGEWHHVAGIIDENKWELYVDCVKVASKETQTNSPDFQNTDLLTIGYWDEGTAEGNKRYFEGTIDELRLYNIAIRPELVSILCDRQTLVFIDGPIEEASINVQIFPNPAKEFLMLKREHLSDFQPHCYSIIDISGRIVDKGKVDSDQIGIRGLTPGTYFLILEDKTQQRSSTKFIKY
ncbi:MAG: T9SS type A sorting domain-containing protein [Cyanothece sp. SIO1E1]|nr:T9SS type A sorting domain-containing protein [Cyanothece sp. SIO1E1]